MSRTSLITSGHWVSMQQPRVVTPPIVFDNKRSRWAFKLTMRVVLKMIISNLDRIVHKLCPWPMRPCIGRPHHAKPCQIIVTVNRTVVPSVAMPGTSLRCRRQDSHNYKFIPWFTLMKSRVLAFWFLADQFKASLTLTQ